MVGVVRIIRIFLFNLFIPPILPLIILSKTNQNLQKYCLLNYLNKVIIELLIINKICSNCLQRRVSFSRRRVSSLKIRVSSKRMKLSC